MLSEIVLELSCWEVAAKEDSSRQGFLGETTEKERPFGSKFVPLFLPGIFLVRVAANQQDLSWEIGGFLSWLGDHFTGCLPQKGASQLGPKGAAELWTGANWLVY